MNVLTVSHVYSVSKEKVWNALTVHKEMIQWYFDNLPAFEAKVGFETRFNVKAPSRDFLHIWKVTEVITGEKIQYSWEFEEFEGISYSTFVLEEVENGTKLSVIVDGLEDFTKYDLPEFKPESGREGWTFFLKERLKDYLEK